MTEKILLIGPFGQIGTELFPELQKKYGENNVIALGHKNIPSDFTGILEKGDIREKEILKELIIKHKITQIYHLASLLSAVGEKKPQLTWDVNMGGLKNILDLAVEFKLKVFWPSSIAVFGPTTPRENTPQHTPCEPTTMYGVTKFAGELLCQYYNLKYGLDVRSVRFPGLISFKAEPGGGTTDYAVAIFYGALTDQKYTSFVNEDTMLPMMYMDDAVKSIMMLMDANSDKIKIRTSYNLTAISFSAKELEKEIQKTIPDLKVEYQPDERQNIADSWPKIIDDSEARKDWGWKHDFDITKMTEVMLENLKKKLDK
jgi:nucleoside-diphosphate-sugar epimerase